MHFSPTTEFDCYELMDNLRPGDRREMAVAHPGLTVDDLWGSCKAPHQATSAFAPDGKLICIFGVNEYPLSPTVGIPWLLGTPLLDRYMLSVCKLARKHVAGWHERYETLTNVTDSRNTRILRWLKWLGFKFLSVVPMGPQAVPFIHFSSSR